MLAQSIIAAVIGVIRSWNACKQLDHVRFAAANNDRTDSGCYFLQGGVVMLRIATLQAVAITWNICRVSFVKGC
jgi:hypothetical protein